MTGAKVMKKKEIPWQPGEKNKVSSNSFDPTDLQGGHSMEVKRLQNSTDITKRGFLQGIHHVSHPNSHSGQIVSIKNIAKGAINIRGEAIAFFPLPPESLSSQEAESLD